MGQQLRPAGELARFFGYDLDKTWNELTQNEKMSVKAAMRSTGGASLNGVPGWFQNQRSKARWSDPYAAKPYVDRNDRTGYLP